jgi:hypothetical protein
MGKLIRRIHYILNRRRLERELEDEMAAHREMLRQERRTSFGRALRLREEARDAWGWTWLDRLRQDLTYGVRILWRAPAFTLAATAVLAFGVGANLAEFHLFDAVFFHRLDIHDAGSILWFFPQSKERGPLSFPFASIEFYREHETLLSLVLTENQSHEVALEDDPRPLRSNFVSGNYFTALRVMPAYGRLLDQRDARRGGSPVAVIGYAYWQRHFGSDPTVVTRIIHVNNLPVEVIGIAPYGFDGLQPRGTAIWFPMTMQTYLVAGSQALDSFVHSDTRMFARVKPGVSISAAEEELRSLTAELKREQPQYIRADERIIGKPLEAIPAVSRVDPVSAMVILLVVFVLVSACANLGNMLLARGVARQRENGHPHGRWSGPLAHSSPAND